MPPLAFCARHPQGAGLHGSFERDFLASIESKATGEESIADLDLKQSDALQLVYGQGETVAVGEQRFGQVEAGQVSDRRARIHEAHGTLPAIAQCTADVKRALDSAR